MTGDGGEYLRPEDLRELGDDSLPSSQFLDGMNYLRYSLEGGRSDRYLPGYTIFSWYFCTRFAVSVWNPLAGSLCLERSGQHLVYFVCHHGSHHFAAGRCGRPPLLLPQVRGWVDRGFEHQVSWLFGVICWLKISGEEKWAWSLCTGLAVSVLSASTSTLSGSSCQISRKENTDTTIIITIIK